MSSRRPRRSPRQLRRAPSPDASSSSAAGAAAASSATSVAPSSAAPERRLRQPSTRQRHRRTTNRQFSVGRSQAAEIEAVAAAAAEAAARSAASVSPPRSPARRGGVVSAASVSTVFDESLPFDETMETTLGGEMVDMEMPDAYDEPLSDDGSRKRRRKVGSVLDSSPLGTYSPARVRHRGRVGSVGSPLRQQGTPLLAPGSFKFKAHVSRLFDGQDEEEDDEDMDAELSASEDERESEDDERFRGLAARIGVGASGRGRRSRVAAGRAMTRKKLTTLQSQFLHVNDILKQQMDRYSSDLVRLGRKHHKEVLESCARAMLDELDRHRYEAESSERLQESVQELTREKARKRREILDTFKERTDVEAQIQEAQRELDRLEKLAQSRQRASHFISNLAKLAEVQDDDVDVDMADADVRKARAVAHFDASLASVTALSQHGLGTLQELKHRLQAALNSI